MSTLTPDIAARFMALTSGHLTREYPHKLDHVLDGPEDAATPSQLHPIFTAVSTGTPASTAGGRYSASRGCFWT